MKVILVLIGAAAEIGSIFLFMKYTSMASLGPMLGR
jgi:hypothetical protein